MAGNQGGLKILIFLALFATQAQAQMLPGDNPEVRAQLAGAGIDPSQIDWVMMDGLCSANRSDNAAYSQCLVQKSTDSDQFRRDTDTCNRLKQRDIKMPSTLAIPYRGITKPPVFNNQLERHEYYRKQHKAMQTDTLIGNGAQIGFSFDDCMAQRGWNDSQNWKAGRQVISSSSSSSSSSAQNK